ncbi:hypothetical protein [Amycolatopsis anabasis]|uniref:hypothetical protein n=1 Tax=Amycolatopsis anabasis TaxID=1840409 RepID=UPI00131E19AC|nr:hypothetical protein [Amycolatopsis anabasis]
MDALELVPGFRNRYRFTAAAPVPRWLARATDGLLLAPEAPALQIARIWDRVEWPRLLAEHSEDLVVAGPVGAGGPRWEALLHAWQILDDADHRPALDVDLDVDVDGRVLELRHGGISTGSGRPVTDALAEQLAEVLAVPCEVIWPASSLASELGPPGTPPEPRAPVRPHQSICDTWWSWLSLGPEDIAPSASR